MAVVRLKSDHPTIQDFADFAWEHRKCETTESHSTTGQIHGKTVTFEADHRERGDRLLDKLFRRTDGYRTVWNVYVEGEQVAGGFDVFDSTIGAPDEVIATMVAAGMAQKQGGIMVNLDISLRDR